MSLVFLVLVGLFSFAFGGLAVVKTSSISSCSVASNYNSASQFALTHFYPTDTCFSTSSGASQKLICSANKDSITWNSYSDSQCQSAVLSTVTIQVWATLVEVWHKVHHCNDFWVMRPIRWMGRVKIPLLVPPLVIALLRLQSRLLCRGKDYFRLALKFFTQLSAPMLWLRQSHSSDDLFADRLFRHSITTTCWWQPHVLYQVKSSFHMHPLGTIHHSHCVISQSGPNCLIVSVLYPWYYPTMNLIIGRLISSRSHRWSQLHQIKRQLQRCESHGSRGVVLGDRHW